MLAPLAVSHSFPSISWVLIWLTECSKYLLDILASMR